MANNKSKSEERATLTITGMNVANVRRLSEKAVAFSLLGNGLGLYNLRVVKGSKGDFIGAPQHKGSDGEYYNDYAVYFSAEDEQKIIAVVMAKLDKKGEGKSDF